MKEITIHQTNNEIKIFDKDEVLNNDEYLNEISKLFTNTNISILQLSNISVLIKPSKIESIIVKDIDESELEKVVAKEDDVITD